MKAIQTFLGSGFLFLLLGFSGALNAQTTTVNTKNIKTDNQALSAKEQSLVAISATAKGDLEKLDKAIGSGLNAGLTVNETKEMLVQLYAYCGFPRSLNGINTLMSVLEKRKKIGVKDEIGREASPISDAGSKYERGKKNLEKLTGRAETGPKTGYAAFSPEIDVFLKEHLFADIFERDVLSFKDREITTIAALVSLGGVEPQLQGHMRIGLNVGLTPSQLEQLLFIIESNVGTKEAAAGRKVLSSITQSKEQK